MRPSSEQNVALVLDTLPECKIVLDALEVRGALAAKLDELNYGRENVADLAHRFRNEARTVEYVPSDTIKPGMVEWPSWKKKPEFKVLQNDVLFVSLAVQRVLGERSMPTKVFNRVTGRTKAAKTIAAALRNIDVRAGQ